MTAFIADLYKETSKGLTENNAATYTRSGSACLDFFAQAGAMRDKPNHALELFKKAFSENNQTAIRILFYLRDIRGGQGERDIFRVCLAWIGDCYINIFKKVISYVSEYGRWDDIFFDHKDCYRVVKDQLSIDYKNKSPSLLAKWLPTINSKNKKTKFKARLMAKNIGLSEIEYRKKIRDIRKVIRIVEHQMSANKWPDINYSNVPSQAARIYRKAFERHDSSRYDYFLESVKAGKETINAGTLYPYQIYDSVINNYSDTLNVLWDNLPDYTQGKNALVVADVSGSMIGKPMSVSVSLALYFAERNKGQFKDYFITFSENPVLQKIQGRSLLEKMNSIEQSDWSMDTNLQGVFNVILKTATQNNTKKHEMPNTIYIISDMEFDCCGAMTNYETINGNYRSCGYEIPNIVFWNVDSRNKNLPVLKDQHKAALFSGLSPAIFKFAVENKTPEQSMMDVVNSDRYNQITI